MITIEQIKHLANLAKINLSEKEEIEFSKSISDIMPLIEKVKDIEISSEINSPLEDYQGDVLQADNPQSNIISKSDLDLNGKGRMVGNYFKIAKDF